MAQLDVDKRISSGVELLNNVFKGPGWVRHISIPDLDLSSAEHCVLGQLARHLPDPDELRLGTGSYNSYALAVDLIENYLNGHPETETSHPWPVEYGFLHATEGGEPDFEDCEYCEGDGECETCQEEMGAHEHLREIFGDIVNFEAEVENEQLTADWRRIIARIYYELYGEYPKGWLRIDYEERGLDYDWTMGLVDEDGNPTGKPDPDA